MIWINSEISIEEREIKLDFIRAPGPGGQKVNKVSTAVQLRFNVQGSPSLPDDVRERLIFLAGKKVTEDGTLIIKAARFRTQVQNRRDALDRLIKLIREASKEPKTRKRTKRSVASKSRILATKRHRSNIKQMRKRVHLTDEKE